MSDTVMLTTSITSSSVEGEEVCAGAAQVCPAGQLPPDCSEPPSANAGTISTNKSTADATNLFIDDSPLVEVVSVSGFRAQDCDYNPADTELFDSLMHSTNYMGAENLCNERLLTVRHPLSAFIWTKDRTIVERARGNFSVSLALLASIHFLALRIGGSTRGKYENGLGRTYQLLRQYDLALDRYTAARIFHEQAGAKLLCASVDNNIGRTLTEAGRPEDSYKYFQRCEEVARQFNDVRLLGEVEESRSLALLAEGRIKEAAHYSLSSILTLSGTEHEDALAESERTHLAIVAALAKGES